MLFSKTPLGRATFRRVIILGSLFMLIWMPYKAWHEKEELRKEASEVYRVRARVVTPQMLESMAAFTDKAIDSSWTPIAWLSINIILLIIAASLISKPVDSIQVFLREVIHDLRGPIAGLLHNVSFALKGYKGPQVALTEMEGSCKEILGIFDDQAEIIRNYNGILKEPVESVDYTDVIQGLFELFRASADVKGVTLNCHIPSQPVVVTAHRAKLQRMASNLIDNAVKYTDKGSITITLKRSLIRGTKLVVEDTGSGMTRECKKRMFDRFYQGADAKRTPGSGNGLPYVMSVVSLYSGILKFWTKLGKGTRFTIYLPTDMTPRKSLTSRIKSVFVHDN